MRSRTLACVLAYVLPTLTMDLEVRVHYPAPGIRNLPGSGAVFSLVLCHEQGCPSNGAWNQSIPGMPYDPQLTIFNESFVGNDLYIKHLKIPGNEGTVYATISACFDPPGDPFGVSSIIGFCDDGVNDPVGDSCANVGMPYRSVVLSPAQAVITAYPYFSMAQGSVFTALENVHSPQFQNHHVINVYVPASLKPNNVRRKVNVLVVN